MSRTYFDHNQNLQVNGDINFISTGEATQDDTGFLQVTQRIQLTNAQSQAVERGFKILCDNTAPSALYGYGHSFTGPRCHPGTRIAVQDYIFKWLDDPEGQVAMWMNGPVGIGKSAIAQTVAHIAAEREQLASAFFFFRSDDTRNSGKHLVPTLAYEMTQQMPLTRSDVCQTLAANPLIFSSSLDRQIHNILLQPLHIRFESSPRARRLIIIDGLDECLESTTQQAIIRSFLSSLLSMSTQIIPLKLFIVSRPESHIASAFSSPNIRDHVKHLPLESWDTEDDIGKFLREKLKEIKDTHAMRHYLPEIWPDEDSLRQLRQPSVGSFAYSSSVIRFLELHKHTPERALQDILSLHPHRNTAAFADLDALYRHILSSMDHDIYITVQKILCLHLYSHEGAITTLAAGLSEEQSILEIAVIHVSSLLYFNGENIGLHHSSFGEFLRDKERSGDHHVFSPNIVSAVATALSNLWLNPVNNHDKYSWFSTIGTSMVDANVDLDIYILRALVETKISASILTIIPGPDHAGSAVSEFFKAIQRRCVRDSGATCGPLYSKAFDVVCLWVRSQLNARFQGLATLNDILDIIGRDFPNYLVILSKGEPGLKSLLYLATKDYEPLDFLCRLFPEMGSVEVCSAIIEKYLTLPTKSRQLDASRRYRDLFNLATLADLYVIIIGRHDAMTPKLCRQLEQFVLEGHNVLHYRPHQNRTSKHCIFRILYGEECHIDHKGKLHIENDDAKDFAEQQWRRVVDKTNHYIYEAHAKLDFPYISEEVAALYRFPPEDAWDLHGLPYFNQSDGLSDFREI